MFRTVIPVTTTMFFCAWLQSNAGLWFCKGQYQNEFDRFDFALSTLGSGSMSGDWA